MGYPIIFETKIIKLTDGRLLHLDLSGCNNDTSGRDRGDFTGKIYTEKEFIHKIESLKTDSKPYKECGEWYMKIGNRCCTYYDYGEHLFRMMKRAETWEKLNCIGRYILIQRMDSVDVMEDGKNFYSMTLEAFDKYCMENKNSDKDIRYVVLKTALVTEEEVVTELDKKQTVSFYIGKCAGRKSA